jgi:hypothetical protein
MNAIITKVRKVLVRLLTIEYVTLSSDITGLKFTMNCVIKPPEEFNSWRSAPITLALVKNAIVEVPG